MKMNRLENVWKTNGTSPNINSIQFHWQQIFFLKKHKKKTTQFYLISKVLTYPPPQRIMNLQPCGFFFNLKKFFCLFVKISDTSPTFKNNARCLNTSINYSGKIDILRVYNTIYITYQHNDIIILNIYQYTINDNKTE